MKQILSPRIVIAVTQGLFLVISLVAGETLAQKPELGRVLIQPEVRTLPAKSKRWALIIGVDKYDDENITPLRGATNDANELAKALREHAGFDENQIIVLTSEQKANKQPTRRNILKYLSNLKGLVPQDGLFLISFSGHGIESNDRAFLIPSDANFTDDVRLLEETAISANVIKRDIKESGVSQVLILLDACRNDPAGGKADSINPLTNAYLRGFEFDVRNREVTAFATLYATSIGARAYEDAEKKAGYFTLAVVEGLRGKAADPKTGEVTLQSLVKFVETNVPVRVAVNLGGRKTQKPFAVIEGFKASELVLAIGASNQTARFDPMTGELALWREVEKSDNREAYEAFLKAYPTGEYAAVANYKLQGAKQKATRVAEYYKRGFDLRFRNANEALANFTKALEINPNYTDAYRERGWVYANRASIRNKPEEYNLALADYNKAIELDPGDDSAFNLRGILFDRIGDHERAIADYTRSIELAPNSTSALFNRAGTYSTIGKNDLAIADYSQYLQKEKERLGSSRVRAYQGRGRAYLAVKNYELALADFNKAIELDSKNDASVYLDRAKAYEASGDKDKANADRKTAEDLKVQNDSASRPTKSPQSDIGANRKSESANTQSRRPLLMKGFKAPHGIEMVYIPPGRFLMGSSTDKYAQPVHEVTISQPFYMGKYEVTQGQWQAVMGMNPSSFKSCGASCPVETISWAAIQDFIRRLNSADDGYTYRLPSEAEWEYACRAGTTGDHYEPSVGDIAWYAANSEGKTHAVGGKQPNAFGLYDMSGNLWEWCLDFAHDNYEGAPADGSAWLSGGEQKDRVFRGGSWRDRAERSRSAARSWWVPNAPATIAGFRVVATARKR